MLNLIKNMWNILRYNTKGNSAVLIIVALIIAAAIIIGIFMYTSNQTHPFWEIK